VTEAEKADDGLLAMVKRVLGVRDEVPEPKQQASAEPEAEVVEPQQVAPIAEPDREETLADQVQVLSDQALSDQALSDQALADPVEEAANAADRKLTVQRSHTAVEIQDLILSALTTFPDAPKKGMTITVYGYTPWNAMVTFAPGSVNSATASTIRSMLQRIVERLREQIEIEIPE
jgi:hypothetical protein